MLIQLVPNIGNKILLVPTMTVNTMSSSLMKEHHDQQEQLMDQVSSDQELSIEAKGSFAEMVVKAATACNRMIIENCSLCTLYCDKQVQYEAAVMERYVTGDALTDLFRTLETNPVVEEYRERLFDEQSVVESVSSRLDE